MFLSLEKAEAFDSRIAEITEDKSVLEEQYFVMRSKYRANQLVMDEAVVKAENAQDLLTELQRMKQSDLSDRMISLSEKLQSMKLGEMRATRELDEVKEKNNYLSRLLRTQNEQVKRLEEKVAESESKIHKREEEFRRADNERMRRFFNARFDDIPGALHSGAGAANHNPSSSEAFFGGASLKRPSAANTTSQMMIEGGNSSGRRATSTSL